MSSALDEIRQTFRQLDRWSARIREPFIPAPDSALAADENVFRPLPPSEMAWQGLVASVDHLRGFRAWLERGDGDLFPIATFSLLRGALVGAALAAWILAPDESDMRIGRSLAAAADWYENHSKWGLTARPLAISHEHHDATLQHIQRRAKEVADLRVGRTPAWPRLYMTSVIRQANAEVWPYDDARELATLSLWQSGSGDAHALGWPLLTRSHAVVEPSDDGLSTFIGNPSDLDVANAYLCPYDFVAFGFHRLAALGGQKLDDSTHHLSGEE